jgi:hypothetical protein
MKAVPDSCARESGNVESTECHLGGAAKQRQHATRSFLTSAPTLALCSTRGVSLPRASRRLPALSRETPVHPNIPQAESSPRPAHSRLALPLSFPVFFGFWFFCVGTPVIAFDFFWVLCARFHRTVCLQGQHSTSRRCGEFPFSSMLPPLSYLFWHHGLV